MEPPLLKSTPSPPARSPLGLAIASLVMGILALVLSFLVIGGLIGLIGLALGVVHVALKRRPTAMATAGIVLSVLGLIAAIGITAFYYTAYRQLTKFTKMAQAKTNENTTDLTKWQGVIAPDFSVTTLDGQTVKLSQLRGKRVVVDFWATWCPPCRQEIPHFIKLFNETSRDDLFILGISDEDAAALRTFIANNGMNYPVASAKNLPPPYNGLDYIPTTFFIDRKGVIQNIAVGYHDYDQLKSDALAPDSSGPAI